MGFNSRMFIKSYLSCGLNRKKTQTWNRSFYLHSTTSIAGTSVVGLANFFFFYCLIFFQGGQTENIGFQVGFFHLFYWIGLGNR